MTFSDDCRFENCSFDENTIFPDDFKCIDQLVFAGKGIDPRKVKTDADLVYSCRLTSEGHFACCTQNLNTCGGLRGALCKHILVLLIGLSRAGELDPNKADLWARASALHQPKLDKEIMSQTFLRYKGAEAGEIDWRPTETTPEDFYAF